MALIPEGQQGDTRGGVASSANAAEDFKRVVRYHIEQVRHLATITEEAAIFPQLLQIEPTNACNLRCVHCHHHKPAEGPSLFTRRRGLMDMEVYRKVIDEIAPEKTAISLNVQGEPTLHRRLLDMVAYAKKRGLEVSLLTNATRLTEELAGALIDLRLDRIVFSFDAVDKEIYEAIRVNAKFEPTLLNVLRFVQRNHECGHPTHICASMVAQQRNLHHIDAYKAYFDRLPVDNVFCSPLLTLSGISGAHKEVDVAALQRGPRETWPICRVPWEYLTVCWDGSVCACPLDVNAVFVAGNVKDQSLHEIWNNQQMRTFRRAHLTKDYGPIETNGPLCGSCNCLWDPDYDLRRFETHAVETIQRGAEQLARDLGGARPDVADEKYENLLAEMAKLGPVLQEVLTS